MVQKTTFLLSGSSILIILEHIIVMSHSQVPLVCCNINTGRVKSMGTSLETPCPDRRDEIDTCLAATRKYIGYDGH